MGKIYFLIILFMVLTRIIIGQTTPNLYEPINLHSEQKDISHDSYPLLHTFASEDSLYLAVKMQRMNDALSLPPVKKSGKGQMAEKDLRWLAGYISLMNSPVASYSRLKMDSLEFYIPVVIPTYDSLHTEFNSYKKNENGFVVEIIRKSFDQIIGEWIFGVREVLESDARGNILVRYEKKWNGSDWQYVAKTTFDRDSVSRLNKSQVYNWNVEEGVWFAVSRTETQYNETGKLVSTRFFDIPAFGEDVAHIAYTYTYDDRGLLISNLSLTNWNPDALTWNTQTRTDYAYNEEGNRTLIANLKFIVADSLWIHTSKVEYVYLEDAGVQLNFYTLNSQTNELEMVNQKHYRLERQYEGDKVIEEIRWEKQYDSQWIIVSKKVYAYNQLGFVTYYANYVQIWGDYMELIEEQIREFNEAGLLLMEKSYLWDNQLNQLKGRTYVEYTRKPDGNALSYTRYKWDSEEQKWLKDLKDYFTYDEEGSFVITRYMFEKSGTQTVLSRVAEASLDYNDETGKYVSLREESFQIQISYNEDLRVDEAIYTDTEYEDEDRRINCYYDEHQRYLKWEIYVKVEDSWVMDHRIDYSYQILSNENMMVSELVNGNYPQRNFYYYQQERLQAFSGYRYNPDGNQWMLKDSIIFFYNSMGQISRVHGKNDYQEYLEEYIQEGNTVNIVRNSRIPGYQDDWMPGGVTVLEVDTSYRKGQIQELPAPMFYDGQRTSLMFHLIFDYGKVISSSEFNLIGEPGELKLYSQMNFYYSPASLMSGEGIISGMILKAPGLKKSVSVSEGSEGEPVAGAIVKLVAGEDDFVLSTFTTGADGLYKFMGVPQGHFYLAVQLEGYPQDSTYQIMVTRDSSLFRNRNFIARDGKLFTNIHDVASSLRIYPNPASSYVFIYSPDIIKAIRIVDLHGRVALMSDAEAVNQKRIPVSMLSNGIYLLEISSEKGITREKLIVQRNLADY